VVIGRTVGSTRCSKLVLYKTILKTMMVAIEHINRLCVKGTMHRRGHHRASTTYVTISSVILTDCVVQHVLITYRKILFQVDADVVTRWTMKLKYPHTFIDAFSSTTSHVHVPRCLPALLPVAVAVVNRRPVREVHDSLHHGSRSRHSQEHPLQHYAVD